MAHFRRDLAAGRVGAGGRPAFRNPVLAETWRRVLQEAETAGHGREGQIEAARPLLPRLRRRGDRRLLPHPEVMDVGGRRHGGLLTADDMAGWQATYEDPVTYDYHG